MTGEQIPHILVAIGDVQRAPKNALRKAAALAKASGASVELFHAIDVPDPRRRYPETATQEAAEGQRTAIAAQSEKRLERFANDSLFKGVKVNCTATWDHPVYDAIVRHALATRASLVIAATRGHRFGARVLLRNTDWELIRHCPVPLLLVKSRRAYAKPVVVTAVDPFHAHDKPASLDVQLLRVAGQIAKWLKGTTHLFHAYLPLVSVEPAPISGLPLIVLPPEAEAAHGQQIASVVDQLAVSAGIPRARLHIRMGNVADELCAVARRTSAGIVVMGGVSRSALARFFIGNTAERVLDKLTCDVLIVKPRAFAPKSARTPGKSVSSRKPAARAGVAQRDPRSSVTTTRICLLPLF